MYSHPPQLGCCSKNIHIDMEIRVGSKYRLGKKIGSGSFGDIYLGRYWLDDYLGDTTLLFSCSVALRLLSSSFYALLPSTRNKCKCVGYTLTFGTPLYCDSMTLYGLRKLGFWVDIVLVLSDSKRSGKTCSN